ncbi:MAG: putative Outer membrane lipoprotein, Slp family [Nitrospira sp.]
MKRASLALSVALLCLVTSACQRTADVIPDNLKGRVDRDLRYADIKDHPESYRGKLMLAGGKVLSAKRTQQGIELNVLQIPLSAELIPAGPDSETKGRFVIIDRKDQVPDPAVFDDEKKRVTVVGEVLGSTTIKIDDVQQQVPELAVKHITIWDWDHMNAGYGPYYGYGYPYAWGYRGYYGYPFYW